MISHLRSRFLCEKGGTADQLRRMGRANHISVANAVYGSRRGGGRLTFTVDRSRLFAISDSDSTVMNARHGVVLIAFG